MTNGKAVTIKNFRDRNGNANPDSDNQNSDSESDLIDAPSEPTDLSGGEEPGIHSGDEGEP